MVSFKKDLKYIKTIVDSIQQRKQYKIVVYTSVIGDYDNLKPVKTSSDVDYLCFTNNPRINLNGWTVVSIHFTYRDPRRLAKIFKILPHLVLNAYDYSVWVDANGYLKKDVTLLVRKYLNEKHEIAFFPHRKRNCAYLEAKTCIRWGKDRSDIIKAQLMKYAENGYPRNNGLISGNFIIRKHNAPVVKQLMEMWWKEIDLMSVRDQLSFNYCCWVMNIDVYYITEEPVEDFIEFKPHPRHVFYNISCADKVKVFLSSMLNHFLFYKNLLLKKITKGTR